MRTTDTVPRVNQFGAHLRDQWMLDPAVTYLNHGTVGAPPRQILELQQSIRNDIERQPATYLLRNLADVDGKPRRAAPLMRDAAAVVAQFVGADVDDLVFLDNATTGANAVLRSYPFVPGDEILVTTFGYGGVTNVANYVARTQGLVVRTITMPPPNPAVGSVHPQAYIDAIAAAIGGNTAGRTKMLLIDHITASTALIMPIAEIAAVCHDRGVLVLVDGAHGPGSIALDIPALGVDWYFGNLHKWAWTPRSAGLLWVAPQHHSYLHAPVTSWGLDRGIAAEFDAFGTRDPSPYLAAPGSIEMMESWGLEDIFDYNHNLAWQAGQLLSTRWNMPFSTPEQMIASMVCVTLPTRLGSTIHDAQRVRDALLFDANIEVPTTATETGMTMRVSTQVYNDLEDIDRLGDAIDRL